MEQPSGGEDEDGDVQKMPLHTFDFLTWMNENYIII